MKTVLFKHFPPERVAVWMSDPGEDFSFPTDDRAEIWSAGQKKYLSSLTDLPVERVATLRQVHGNKILAVPDPDVSSYPLCDEGDGLIARCPQQPLAIRTADCLPIFFYENRAGLVGLVHAGWRGTQKQIAVHAVQKMRKDFNADMTALHVVLGPCLRPCCYEVGEAFTRYFPTQTVRKKNRYFFDLAAANKAQLVQSGVVPENIQDTRVCTCCPEQYFSYRRQGEKAGRMIFIIMLKK